METSYIAKRNLSFLVNSAVLTNKLGKLLADAGCRQCIISIVSNHLLMKIVIHQQALVA